MRSVDHPTSTRDCEYVIVGAGSAGCVLANRLSEDGSVRVLLLEAGGTDRKLEIRIPAAFARLYRSDVDWGYWTAPQAGLAGREIYFPRGKTLGGSSSINAQMVIRGHRDDYDGWAAHGNAGWAWEDVLPYFDRSERGPFLIAELRDRNPLTDAFVAAAVQAGVPRADDLNAPSPEGVGYVPVSQRRGRRWSVADGYLRPALTRGNLTVLTRAQCRLPPGGSRRARPSHAGGDPVRRSDQLAAALARLGDRPA